MPFSGLANGCGYGQALIFTKEGGKVRSTITIFMDNTEKLSRTKQILQRWLDKQGHDRCWYYPDLFRELVDLFELSPTKNPTLPSRMEFEKGCKRYQEEEYARRQDDNNPKSSKD